MPFSIVTLLLAVVIAASPAAASVVRITAHIFPEDVLTHGSYSATGRVERFPVFAYGMDPCGYDVAGDLTGIEDVSGLNDPLLGNVPFNSSNPGGADLSLIPRTGGPAGSSVFLRDRGSAQQTFARAPVTFGFPRLGGFGGSGGGGSSNAGSAFTSIFTEEAGDIVSGPAPLINVSSPSGGTDGDHSGSGTGATVSPTFTTPAPVPLPPAGWLLLAGIGGLGALARRRRV